MPSSPDPATPARPWRMGSRRPAVIFLNRYFYPDHSATSQMLSDLAFALAQPRPADDSAAPPDAEDGRRIVIISSRLRYDGPGEPLVGRETIQGVEVHRVWTSSFGRAALAGRAIDYVTFYLSAAWRLWRLARRGDVVVAKTDPPMLSVVTSPVARLRGARRVNWLQDLFPEVAEAIGIGVGKARPVFGLLRGLRNRSVRAADINVALGERMAARLIELGVRPEKIRVIPNWADGQLLQPVEHRANPLRTEWNLGDSFVVGYSGNLGRAHEIETMLGAMARAPVEAARAVSWLFVGGGALLATLEQEVARRGIERVQFRPYQPRSLLARSLSVADVHLVSLQPALEGLIVPSKIYGILAVGRPCIFIGDSQGEIAQLITRHGCGRVVAPGDASGLWQAISELAADPRTCGEMGERARRLLLAEFDMPVAVDRWRRLLAELGNDATDRERQTADR